MGVKYLVLNKNVTLVDHFVSTMQKQLDQILEIRKFIKLFDLDILSISKYFLIFLKCYSYKKLETY